MIIEGRNAVYELLSSDKAVEKLLIDKDAADGGARRIISLAKSRNIKIQALPKEVLNKQGQSGRHQGFIAYTADYEYADIDEIISGGGIAVMLDGIVDTHNLGSIIRVCECAGASGVVIAKDRQVPVNETVVRISEGAASHVKVAKVTNLVQAIDSFKKGGFFVYGAEVGGEDIYKQSFAKNSLIIIGGEDTGIRRIVKENCDVIVSIPLLGKINSLSAPTACAVAVYEAVRQRQ